MARVCEHCGKEGTFKEIKTVDLPVSGSTRLCHACSMSLFKVETQEFNHQQRWKEDVLRRFPESMLKQFCREHDIATSEQRSALAATRRGTRQKKYYTYHYNFDELLHGALQDSSLQTVLDFARKKHVPIEDITAQIDRHNANRGR
jgi:hypothetical protein